MAKVLATTIFGVGFVTPLMFSNIAEAENFGAGGTGQWLSNDVLDKTSTTSTTKATSQWATQTGRDAANYVMLDGYKFKIVAVEGTGSSAKVTLWSYDTKTHGTETGFGTAKCVSSGSTWGTAEVQGDINKAYAAGGLAATVDGLISKFSTETQGRIQTVTLADETNINSSGYGCDYKTANGSADLTAKVWLPSWTEVKETVANGGWGLTSNDQRVIGSYSWLRSPDPVGDVFAYGVSITGGVSYVNVAYDYLLRPALQILNQTSYVFTTNVTIPTNGVFTADGSGTATSYALNNTATIVPTFTPATDGVTLDGTKIGIKTTDKSSGTYAMAGLLTEEADSAKNDTWAKLNGPSAASTKGISYMAQVSSNELDLSGVATDTDYTLKIFGMKTADTTVTELADNAVNGLSIGSDGKIHMKVSSTVNNGVKIKLKGGAVVDLTGDATNAITTYVSDTGTLNLGTSNYTHSGNITDNGTLTVEGIGTLAGTISGSGKIVIDGTISADADKFTQEGGLEVKDNDDVLNLTAGTLSMDVTNNGTVKLNGATMDGAHVTTGTLEFAQDISLDATYVAATTNIVDNGVNLTLTGTDKVLGQAVSGAGKVIIDGTISADASKFTQTGGLEVKKNLVFTSSGLNVNSVGGFIQTAGSSITVPASIIEATSNDPAKAMFKGVDDASKFNVSAGNLTLTGTVQEGKYYVLAKGSAVGGAVTASDLWKTENIDFSGVLLAEYDTNVAGGSIALKMTKVATFEEGSTSGLAAVQQGNISVAKEFTDEVANRLSFVQRPSLKAVKVEPRDVANTAKDDYKVETVEQGNANEVMPSQVTDKDKYDKEVWASYIRTKETTEGMKLGAGVEGNNTAQYNGAVVGVDFYSSDKAIAGVAFSYTTGDIDSYSGETATRNKSKYYGVSFYDRVTNGNNALIYDIGYIKGDNDISQFYTGQETTADVKTDTYTAGVRYEAEFGTKESRVVPFASFRYMRQNNKDYTNSHGTRFESKNQNLYIPKVGIAWTGDFIMPQSVWTWRPSVEAGYVWNLGDRSVDGNVLMGTTIAGVEYDTVDKSSYYAKAGMEFINKNFTAGVFYRYLKGNAVRNNKWNVNVAWSF